ncbi:MAG: site-specific recombinase [Actinoplanes sp.]|jgi:site-specific DNA recombinase|nr:site-specific recombinase [Actinoplanes sp.]
MSRVLGAIRLSRETDESTSVTRQRQVIKAWTEAHSHTLVKIIEDIDVSGGVSPWDREGLGPWLDEKNHPDLVGSYDLIVAAKIDRLGRKIYHFSHLIEWCNDRGKSVVAVAEGIDTSNRVGKMVAQILSIFAELERDLITERISESKAYAKREGHWLGSVPPYGYTPVRGLDNRWRLEQNSETIGYLREMIQRVMNGETLSAICVDLTRRGIPTAKGKARWARSPAERMLMNKILLGHSVSVEGRTLLDEEGMPVQRAEPLLAISEWDQLQSILKAAKWTRKRATAPNLLADVGWCANCGRRIHRTVAKRGYTYLMCAGRRNRDCLQQSFREDKIYALIDGIMLLDTQLVRKRVWVPGTDSSGQLETTKRLIAELEEMHKEGLVGDLEQHKRNLRQLILRRDDLALEPSRPSGWSWVETGDRACDVWAKGSQLERHNLLKETGMEIYLGRTQPFPAADEAVADEGSFVLHPAEPPAGYYVAFVWPLFWPMFMVQEEGQTPVS